MKLSLLTLLMVLASSGALARGLTAQQSRCLSQIRNETDFIISRIDLIHRDYEQKIKRTDLGKFKSGDYSTVGLLDNSIRKYHRTLVKRLKKYPFQYRKRIRKSHHKSEKPCLAEQLRDQSVGTIREFELSWEKTMRKAKDNASYFKQVDGLH